MLSATLASAAIPLGAATACVERIRPKWLEQELRRSVIAFGGGVLIAAVALVLMPEGVESLSVAWALVAFGAGGVAFFLLDRAIERRGGAAAQLTAMLLDFVPESLAMGAMLATDNAVGALLAALIALQNFPEGFNSILELRSTGRIGTPDLLAMHAALVVLGPLAAWLGFRFFYDEPQTLGAVMLVAAGGILYLTFEEIAPQAVLERAWAPPLGAVAGFMLGMLGHMLVA